MARGIERLVAAERSALRNLGSVDSGVLDDVVPRLGRSADHGLLWLGIAGGLALSGPAGRRAAFLGLVALSFSSAVTNVLFKPASRRDRPPSGLVPPIREPRRTPFTTSFPSGHAASAAAFTTVVVRELPWTGVPLVPLAVAVAASRVVIGVHYPSDVVAGVVLGTGVAWAVRGCSGWAAP